MSKQRRKHVVRVDSGTGQRTAAPVTPAGEVRIPATQLHAVLEALITSVRGSLRLVVEGQSSKVGTVPSYLHEAMFDVTGLKPGSTQLPTESRPLGEACPELFAPEVGLEVPRDYSALDVMGKLLSDAMDSGEDAQADPALLRSYAALARASGGGLEIQGLAGRSGPLVLQPEFGDKFDELAKKTPEPREVRIAGTLDQISDSSPRVKIKMKSADVEADLDEHDRRSLRNLWGNRVEVSGTAHYKPSGDLRRIEVRWIGPASEGSELWEEKPTAAPREVAEFVPQRSDTGVNAFFGTWPGDETDEELLALLSDVRR